MKKLLIICFAALVVYACKHEIIISTAVPTNLVYLPTGSSILKGIAGNSVAPTIDNGGGTITYNITSTAVDGIAIDNKTGVVSWTNAVSSGTYNITVTATNSIGSTATTYTLTINTSVTAPSNLSYSPSSSTVVKATAGNSATPAINNGGSETTFSLTGTVSSGVTINSSTGVISWSNTVAVGNYALTVTATNTVGNTTAAYTLTVTSTPTVVAPTGFAYNPSSSIIVQGIAGSSVTPTINNGLGIIAYSLTGTVPSGITINSSTGIISWSSSVTAGTYNLTATATNSAGNTTTTYSLTITAAGNVCFSSDVLPLYQSYCAQTGCHNSVSKRDGVVTDSYSNIMRGISANKPNSSKYYTVIGGKMPPNGSAQMSAAQKAIILNWINQGATNTTCATATCDTTQYTYTNGISALFATNCNGCHGVAPGSGNVVLSDYTSAKTAGITLKASFLNAINYTSTTSAMNMPPSGQLSSCQITQITKWINNGCPQ